MLALPALNTVVVCKVFVLWNRYMDIARNNTAIVHPMLEVVHSCQHIA